MINDMKDCSRINNKYVYKEKYPLFLLPIIHNDCEALLYTHPQKIPEKRVSAIHKTIFIKILKINSWIFVSPNDETLTIKCQNFEDSIRLNNSGILVLAPHCIAFTSSVTLKPIDTKEANESFINTNYFQNLDIKNEINNQDLRFSFMETLSLNKSILVLPDQNEKLAKISYSIDVLKAKEQKMLNQKSIDFNHIHHYILVYLVVFLIDNFDALLNKIDRVLSGVEPQQSTSATPVSSDAEIMNEVFERHKRMNNIMIFNYGPIADQPETAQVSSLLSNITAQQINVSKVAKVGKPNKNGHRALKVTLINASDVGLILRNKIKAIRDEQIYIETDMTPKQRSELHTVRSELNEHNKAAGIRTEYH
ncbi:unnamed protein product [Ceutorhynchus assimilis]|uniref:Uncharacterized protein n=1 Tax=Ceutorhynchus assimilis TaxID=467358 RepID=A0A9N9MSD0_9CUCU|nr:unnamed protein product [Ceutorhynchus assimilis]